MWRAAMRAGALAARCTTPFERVLMAQGVLTRYVCIAVPHGEDDETLTRNSQQFHEHSGYRLVGEFELCGYKGGRWYNMVWMGKDDRRTSGGPASGEAVFGNRRFCRRSLSAGTL